ncbi:MAG: C-GCAxxG-C-C family protein [Desulfobacterales bacterium]|nr:C-GCAxxG-C-C family protein [Desulfobacterales bacterium]
MSAHIPTPGHLPALIAARAKNLFLSRRMDCSEAVLVTLNQGLGGSLEAEQALALAAPFSEGIGRSGCMCGAVAGALLAIGILVCGTARTGRSRSESRKAAAEFMDSFKSAFGSSCCRILSNKGARGSASRFARCSELTAAAASTAAVLILDYRPELIRSADPGFLGTRDSALGGLIENAVRRAGLRITPARGGFRRR